MNGTLRSTRDIAKAAVRAELARVAFEMFARDGFDSVTITEVAAAAGVSRSTFLRYFGTKEDAILGVLDAQGAAVAGELRGRPAREDDWTALRRALGTLLAPYLSDPARALTLARMVRDTPSLYARQLEKHHSWRPLLADALAEREGTVPGLRHTVRSAAALDCLAAALEAWTSAEGRRDLLALLDEAFAALR
ncbi:TetR/AcrR family transcriptional regulator [Actinocorallia sp. API 0066]|uniref:TetR family transcriptional regulator n=1 Tax=Actinocorallia sp. API 0066 TaxID=2896846 RepID=UPI001E501259|nr:TetR family transcriptional regulator [Actinocorallia sp. API 0066]MCD0448880.1 TetR/AcrR family transcriptional regulator [Actinocorallia sp. API 0066]